MCASSRCETNRNKWKLAVNCFIFQEHVDQLIMKTSFNNVFHQQLVNCCVSDTVLLQNHCNISQILHHSQVFQIEQCKGHKL